MKTLAQKAYQLTRLRLSREQIKALAGYAYELQDWNQRFNLTAIQNDEDIHTRHFLDSLSCLLAIQRPHQQRLIDVGTGAGFPGLVLKIAYPSLRLTLVESVRKKADFCQHMVKQLNLPGVEVVQERAEIVGQNPVYREQFDWAVARAVAILPVLAEYLLPFVRVGGSMLAMKGSGAPAETQAAEHALPILGGRLRELIPVTLPGVAEERYLVVVDKIAATPEKYPRRVGIPTKRPLRH